MLETVSVAEMLTAKSQDEKNLQFDICLTYHFYNLEMLKSRICKYGIIS